MTDVLAYLVLGLGVVVYVVLVGSAIMGLMH